MKKYFASFIFLSSLFSVLSVKSQTLKPVMPANDALKDMNSLMSYYEGHMQFTGDFLAYDTHGRLINKEQLFKQTATGNYLPLQVYSKQGAGAYQLYKLPSNTKGDVRTMLKQIGYSEYGIYQTIGKPLPAFHYVDLNGHVYSSANTKGKIMVLKAWSISCIPCVEEMPELNKLVEKYKNRKDIIFVSIAYDSRPKLQAFMKKRKFDYAVVPMPMSYIQGALRVAGYPAHWVINKQGIVVNMSYDKSEMIAALDKEAKKK